MQQTSPEWLDIEVVKTMIRTGRTYVNRPFSGQNFAQVLNIGSALVVGHIPRRAYEDLKQDIEFEEQPLPTEDGLCDWRGIMLRRSHRTLTPNQRRKLPQNLPRKGKQAVARHA